MLFSGLAANFVPSQHSITVVEGAHVEFICESDDRESIAECRFEVPGFASQLKIYDGLKREKYEFIGEGLKNGQCGLRLHNANRISAGKVTCKLILDNDNLAEQLTEIKLNILHTDKLNISSNSIGSHYEYEENQPMEINCATEGGYPTSTLTLYIGIPGFEKENILAL